MPCHMARRVASLSSRAAALPVPTRTVTAESPCQPATIAPQSIDTLSPSASTRGPGMPCTTSEFTEMQVTAG